MYKQQAKKYSKLLDLLIYFIFISSFSRAHSALAATQPSTQNVQAQETAKPALQAAQKAFDELDYQKAEGLFQELLADPQMSNKQRAIAALHLGIIALGQGAEARARTLFLQALDLDRDIQMAPDASPKLQGLFAELKARVAQAKKYAPADDTAAELQKNHSTPVLAAADKTPTATNAGNTQTDAAQSQNPAATSAATTATETKIPTTNTQAPPGAQAKKPADNKTKKPTEQGQNTWLWGSAIGAGTIAAIAGGVALYLWLNSSTTDNPDKPDPTNTGCQAPDGEGCVVVHF